MKRRTPRWFKASLLAGTSLFLCIPKTAESADINGRCYPHPITIGVNEQPPEDAALIRAANIEWVRITIPWREVNPSPGVWKWGGMDALIDSHSTLGNKVLGTLSTAPRHAGSNENGNKPPGTVSDRSSWQEFVRRAATRYQGKVKAYEIWNEPNFDDLGVGIGWVGAVHLDGQPDQPPTYAQYVKDAAAEIRSHAPGTLVVAPSTSSEPNSKTVEIFKSLEDQGASSSVDVVSFHANGQDRDSTDTVWSHISSQLNTLRRQNPSSFHKPIWITEFGWRSSEVDEDGQRDRIRNIARRLTHEWKQISSPSFCTGLIEKTALAFIYKDRDTTSAQQGIFSSDGSAKPVTSGFLQTLPAPGVQPAEGYNRQGYRPFRVSCSELDCTFTSEYDDTGFTTYDWDFGDGTTATGKVVDHTFPAKGSYHVFHGALGILEWPTDARIIEVP